MAIETRKSFCRMCHAFCAVDVDTALNKVVAVRGDAGNPIFGGYTTYIRMLVNRHVRRTAATRTASPQQT